MEIRKDFLSVSDLLNRLIQYSNVFDENNKKHWSHYVNKEDYEKIYSLENIHRNNFEKLYSVGRDCAVALSTRLIIFNYPERCPSLTSFIDSLEKGWIYQHKELFEISRQAKASANNIKSVPFAVQQMILLFDSQLELIKSAKNTIEQLKKSTLYLQENGSNENPEELPWWESFDRRVAIFGLIVAVIGLWFAIPKS